MTQDILRYDLMVQDALKGVVRKILTEAGRDGLPGEHHFYITFRTTAPGVRVSQRLRDKHPDEMTIVLQHQFWDLNVGEHSFEVGLSFGGVPERLLVPFDAVTTFFDPSVQFGLKFEPQEAGEAAVPVDKDGTPNKSPRGAGSEPTIAPAALPARLAPVPMNPAAASVPAIATKQAERNADTAKKTAAKSDGKSDADAAEDGGSAQVVSLDSFRKKT